MKQQNKFMRIMDAKLVYALGCLTAILIFFQANFSLDQFQINLNLADIFAICGVTLAILHNYYSDQLRFRIPQIQTFIMAATVAYALAFAIGWLKFGFSSFAFFSKFLVLYVLFGYAALGAVFVSLTGNRGIVLLTKTMSWMLITILVIKLAFIYCSQILNLEVIANPGLMGYAMNRNTFAFQLLSVVCLQLALNRSQSWLLSFMIACIYFTYSLSAIITTVTLLSILCLFRFSSRQQLLQICLQTLLFIAALLLVEHTVLYFAQTPIPVHQQATSIFSSNLYSNLVSNQERLYSLVTSLRLWSDSPIFGIGLGGFAHHEVTTNNSFLVINNTFIWLLVEFGIVGLSIFACYGWLVLRHFYTTLRQHPPATWDVQDRILLNICIIFVLMGNVHEIFYQRIFWFLLGTAVVAYERKHMLTSENLKAFAAYLKR